MPFRLGRYHQRVVFYPPRRPARLFFPRVSTYASSRLERVRAPRDERDPLVLCHLSRVLARIDRRAAVREPDVTLGVPLDTLPHSPHVRPMQVKRAVHIPAVRSTHRVNSADATSRVGVRLERITRRARPRLFVVGGVDWESQVNYFRVERHLSKED